MINLIGKKVLFITGSGVSVQSGIKTFYSKDGMYLDPKDNDGLTAFELLSDSMLKSRPEKTWGFIFNMYSSFKDAKPNDFHDKVNSILENDQIEARVLTMNIDGLQGKSKKINEIHGNINISQCPSCETIHDDHFKQMESGLEAPICSKCGTVLFPDTVLFGQMPKENEEITGEIYDIIFIVGVGSPQHYILETISKSAFEKKSEIYFVDPNQTLDDVMGGYLYQHIFHKNTKEYKETASEFIKRL